MIKYILLLYGFVTIDPRKGLSRPNNKFKILLIFQRNYLRPYNIPTAYLAYYFWFYIVVLSIKAANAIYCSMCVDSGESSVIALSFENWSVEF